MSKKPWELHAIVILQVLFFGVTISERWFGSFNESQGMILGSIVLALVGLFRGNRFVWWITICVFSVLSMVTLGADGSLIAEHGFRSHWLLRNAHALVLLSVGTLGLLLSCWFRDAMPPPAATVFEDAPLLGRIAGVSASLLFLGGALVSLSIVALIQYRRYSDVSYCWTSLKTVTSAEADFRANDRDSNGRQDFWTGDVQGLYGLIPKGGTAPIKLIEYSIARSDGDPLLGVYPPIPEAPYPKIGAWTAALREDRSVTPSERYRSPNAPLNTDRFGFILYPDDYIGGNRWAYIVNENNTVFRRQLIAEIKGSDRLPPGPVRDPECRHWPSDEELRAKWSKLD